MAAAPYSARGKRERDGAWRAFVPQTNTDPGRSRFSLHAAIVPESLMAEWHRRSRLTLYSCLNAVNGCTLAARRAGTYDASPATSRKQRQDDRIRRVIRWCHAEQQRTERRQHHERKRHAGGRADGRRDAARLPPPTMSALRPSPQARYAI